MTTKVLILDTMLLEYVKRRLGNSGQCLETRREIGFAGEDAIHFVESKCKIYRSIHWAGEHYTRIEHVLVGNGQWHIPKPPHPDCLVVREPHDGEIFDSDRELLWLAPVQCRVLKGTLAARIFEGKHGEVVGPLEEYLQQAVFDECLNSLTAEYDHEIEGDTGRLIIDTLIKRLERTLLTDADEAVTYEIAEEVHRSVLKALRLRSEEAT